MRLLVFSHKPCWTSTNSKTGYATDGGFPIQMAALSELFDETIVLVPCGDQGMHAGEMSLEGSQLSVCPLPAPLGAGFWRKLLFPLWCLWGGPTMLRALRKADAVHCPIPGDIGTVGMLLAWLFRKPLLVRHCGNWLKPVTAAEKFWRWFMETTAGGRNVMLATGGTGQPPSEKNPNVHWIFSSSLTESELTAYSSPRSFPSGSSMRLIHVARQELAKGAGTIIQSLPVLMKHFPGIGLDIVGEGTALPGFKQLAEELGVGERVRFSGKLNHRQVMERLREAHLFVFPTTSSDGFPKAVLEGLASGLPIVATKVSVLPKLLGNGCGVLMEEATAGALARSVELALANAQGYEAMSLKAIETARQFSLEAWRDTIGQHLAEAWGTLKTVENREQKVASRNSAASGPVVS